MRRILLGLMCGLSCLLSWRDCLAQPGLRPVPARGPGGAAAAVPWSEAEYVFSAKLESVQAGPVAKSLPPIYNHTLHLTVDQSLRGPAKAGEKLNGHHAARQNNEPTFPVGKLVLVAASKTREGLTVRRLEESNETLLKQVGLACQLPLGWKLDGDKAISPWAELGKQAWPADAKLKAALTCSATGRPALLCGAGVTLTVEHVLPKVILEFSNPDGDGEYRLKVKNTTDKPVEIPALLSNDKEILWNESLVILCQGHTFACPGAEGVSGPVQATTLPAGKSVSTVVQIFALKGPEWPQGGSRVEFQFCLGELSQSKSFYYLWKHHDPIRKAIKP